MYDLDKFLKAHDEFFYRALNEIKEGHKKTHWMWFIFPQIKGLGNSNISKYYEIKDIEEAKAFLENKILKSHLFEISEALLELKTNNPLEVFGYPDNLKLHSSMTLFDYIEPNNIFEKVLDKFYEGNKDKNTMSILEK